MIKGSKFQDVRQKTQMKRKEAKEKSTHSFVFSSFTSFPSWSFSCSFCAAVKEERLKQINRCIKTKKAKTKGTKVKRND